MTVAIDLFGAEYGYLVLLGDNYHLEFRVRQDKDGNKLGEPEEQISHTIFEKVIKNSKSLVIADAILAPDFQDAESVKSLQLRSVMCVPLIARGRTLGAIYLENRSEESVFEDQDIKPLEYFAAQAAISIENAMLNNELESRVEARTAELAQANELLRQEIELRKRIEERLHRLAITDFLTGVFNRRHFFDLVEREVHRSRRYGHPVSIALFDIDSFKEINDTYGHVAGDQVLQIVVDRFLNNLRQTDVFGRYGGDEFVILLPETPPSEALQAMERLHQDVTQQTVDIGKGTIPLSISMGVACLSGADDAEKLFTKADRALYAAKAAGRNRVMAFEDIQAGITDQS